MKKIMLWMLAAILICGSSVFTSCTSNDDNTVSPVERQYCATVQHLVTALDANPQVKQLVEKSIAKAKEINPDRVTNPAQTLTECYDFLD